MTEENAVRKTVHLEASIGVSQCGSDGRITSDRTRVTCERCVRFATCSDCFEHPCACEPLQSNDNVPSLWGKVRPQ